MKQLRSEAGFSLVELLAVVLILSVLSAVAVPLYLNTRREAAARTCAANIAAIAAAESAYSLRHGAYVESVADAKTKLVGATEGLAEWPQCPLTMTADDYTITPAADTAADQGITISCGNKDDHVTDTGRTAETESDAPWNKFMKEPAPDAYTPGPLP